MAFRTNNQRKAYFAWKNKFERVMTPKERMILAMGLPEKKNINTYSTFGVTRKLHKQGIMIKEGEVKKVLIKMRKNNL